MQVRKDDWHQDHGSADREKGTDSAGTQEVNLRAGLWDLRDGRGQILSTLLHSHLAESSTIQRWTAAGSTGLREEAEFSWDLWIRDGDESPGGSVQRTVGDTRL